MTSDPDRRNAYADGLETGTPVDQALLTIGRIVGAHGLNGDLKVSLATDRPERMKDLRRIYLDGADTPSRVTRFQLRGGSNREALLKLQGINDRNSAETLRGSILQIRGNQLPPPDDGAFFHYQILGLLALDESGQELGSVTEIIDAGEVDVYVVTDHNGSQMLFPALHDVILDIDPVEQRLIVRPQVYRESEAQSR